MTSDRTQCSKRTIGIPGILIAILVLVVGLSLVVVNPLSIKTGAVEGIARHDMSTGTNGKGPTKALARQFSSCLSFVRKPKASTSNMSQPDAMPRLVIDSSSNHLDGEEDRSRAETTLPGSRMRAQSIGADSDRASMVESGLGRCVSDGKFWTIPDDEVLVLIRDEFPAEMDRLKHAYSVKNSGVPRPGIKSMSERIYDGKNYDEINRTLLGVLALRWIVNNDYDSFVKGQKAAVQLSKKSFKWLHNFFWDKLNTPEDAYSLILSMIINDLGKNPSLASDYAQLKGEDISNVNHDMILLCAIEAGMVPALNKLSSHHRDILTDGIRLGSELNFGQLAQAENAPAALVGLEDMRGKDRAFQFRFMEQVLDVSGAKGHEDWTAALVMIEPVFQSYHNVYDVASGIISGVYTLRQGFDTILTRKMTLLRAAGYTSHAFTTAQPQDRAMLRVFCLGNTNSPQQAEILRTAFLERMPEPDRIDLIHGLNVDGSEEEPAIQPTYAPAMLTKAMGNTLHGTDEEKIAAATAMLRYLAKVFRRARTITSGVTVVEREVRIVDKVVGGEEFRRRPEGLVREGVPEDRVANRVR